MKDEECPFCRIVAGEIPASKVLETDDLVAFHDLNPQAPVHLLVIPRRHVSALQATGVGDAVLLGRLLVACRDLAAKHGIASGYRVVTNCGAEAGQSVFHLHFHLLGGRAMSWPPG